MPKTLRVLLVALVAIATFGASKSVTAGANLPARITICYDAKTRVVRFAKSGRCARGSRAIVVGRGLAGPRGAKGLRGLAGPVGGTGGVGPAGPAGAVGGTGATGPAGTNVFHTVSATSTANNGPLTVSCPSGEVVTGGGFVTSAAASGVALTDSFPNAQRNGWTVQYSGGPTIEVTAYAICVAGVNS